MYSLIVPVYRNADSLAALMEVVAQFPAQLDGPFETVFVVDGSPDASLATLQRLLPTAAFPATVLSLSRNFGSFAAIRAGMRVARGPYLAIMAADLHEPPDLALEIFRRLRAGNPAPATELEYRTPFELLLSVILSAQATDKSVNLATRELFKVAEADREDVKMDFSTTAKA